MVSSFDRAGSRPAHHQRRPQPALQITTREKYRQYKTVDDQYIGDYLNWTTL
jgi:hypothetical protein